MLSNLYGGNNPVNKACYIQYTTQSQNKDPSGDICKYFLYFQSQANQFLQKVETEVWGG
jgi:hypothetical protein